MHRGYGDAMPISEYAWVFVRSSRERLAVAERLVRAAPAYVGAEGELDLHHCEATGYLAAVVRAAPEAFTPEVTARLGFWSARAGARGFPVDALPEVDRARFRAELDLCERAAKGTRFEHVQEVASRFFRALRPGAPAEAPGARPVLAVDLDGPGAKGIAYRPEARALFVAGALAPPAGDQLAVSVREARAPAPVEGWATVVAVRGREEAAPGSPAGFTLWIEGPAALHELLARRARGEVLSEVRAAPRFPVIARVKVIPAAVASAPPRPEAPRPTPTPRPRARVEYATEQELAADWIENLSHGGAFVRTASPQPQGAEITLELALPDGVHLEARAVVAFVNAKGMGVRFVLSPEQDQVLCAAMTRISARPSRVLVVDDDALSRQMLADAFAARGFEVLTAHDAESGLRTLIDELLTLDLFVTDLVMPKFGGEALIRVIREAGGEADLAIVAVSARLDPAAERVLESAGADAVLDKSLGPELVAQAADAALERKRLVRQADAA